MFIDYIYLLLIITVICFIIFMIYLSYEYRNIECTYNESRDSKTIDNESRIIENFLVPELSNLSSIKYNLDDLNAKAKDINTNYINLNDELYNKDISRDNIKNINVSHKQLQHLADSKLLNVANNNLKSIPMTFPIDKLIKTIKSKYNSQYLSTTSNDSNNYGILVNEGCLTVNGLCKDEYCTLNCQSNLYSSDSQKFKTTRIESNADAAKVMNIPIERISTKNIYPFNIFTSLVNNKCLSISNDGISVDSCNLNNIRQQWEISPDENICVLE
jgi:hypothetical protein